VSLFVAGGEERKKERRKGSFVFSLFILRQQRVCTYSDVCFIYLASDAGESSQGQSAHAGAGKATPSACIILSEPPP